MNSQIMHQLRDLPSFCAALYELTKVDKSMGADLWLIGQAYCPLKTVIMCKSSVSGLYHKRYLGGGASVSVRHIMMEDRDFFPAALKALEPQDWTEIASALTNPEDPLFSEAAEETFDALRARILQLEQEAEAERH